MKMIEQLQKLKSKVNLIIFCIVMLFILYVFILFKAYYVLAIIMFIAMVILFVEMSYTDEIKYNLIRDAITEDGTKLNENSYVYKITQRDLSFNSNLDDLISMIAFAPSDEEAVKLFKKLNKDDTKKLFKKMRKFWKKHKKDSDFYEQLLKITN